MIDFSILKNVDFTNTDNLLFLVALLVITVVILFVFLFIILKIIKAIKKILRRIFNKNADSTNSNQKDQVEDLKVVVSELEKSKEDRAKILTAKIIGGDFNRSPVSGSSKTDEKDKNTVQSQKEKTEEDITEQLSKLKSGNSASEGTLESKMPSRTGDQEDAGRKGIKIPTAKVVGGNFTRSSSGASKSGEKEENSVQSDKEKSAKDITDQLSKLKSGNSDGEGTLESKMPSRTGDQEDAMKGGVKMPTSSGLRGQPLASEKVDTEVSEAAKETSTNSVEDILKPPLADIGQQLKKDDSIFGGKEEITRSELRQDLKGASAYKASRSAGLNLSSIERAKLEKEVFSQRYGRNISKTDLKSGIRQLNKKLLGAKTDQEHAKIRKEIKFFKKIGGIKG